MRKFQFLKNYNLYQIETIPLLLELSLLELLLLVLVPAQVAPARVASARVTSACVSPCSSCPCSSCRCLNCRWSSCFYSSSNCHYLSYFFRVVMKLQLRPIHIVLKFVSFQRKAIQLIYF